MTTSFLPEPYRRIVVGLCLVFLCAMSWRQGHELRGGFMLFAERYNGFVGWCSALAWYLAYVGTALGMKL